MDAHRGVTQEWVAAGIDRQHCDVLMRGHLRVRRAVTRGALVAQDVPPSVTGATAVNLATPEAVRNRPAEELDRPSVTRMTA
ncbi:hypothetical protein [Streptomyces sp. NPDC001820]|uniref:hypothetical protein n=1 Tax=Streptomyces sp. NPDC001820 TaxID=3364613 RepID=UPI0036C921C2